MAREVNRSQTGARPRAPLGLASKVHTPNSGTVQAKRFPEDNIVGWNERLLLAVAPLAALIMGACATEAMLPTVASGLMDPARCGTCHAAESRAWRDAYHSKMVRTPQEGLLKEAVDNWAKDSEGNTGPTRGNIDGNAYQLADVQFVIGSKWKQRYLVRNAATGNHQFLDKQWNRYTNAWEPYGQKNDWETQCSTCHAGDGITASGSQNSAAREAARSEKNAGCEACHGPGAQHAAARGQADL
jgi:hypothetical protein